MATVLSSGRAGTAVNGAADARVDCDEFLTFRLSNEEYAIDILQVQEIRAQEPVTRIANAPAYVLGIINLRGRIVPIVDLRVRLGMPVREQRSAVTIILDLGGSLAGVVVDAVSDVIALEAREIRPAPEFGGGTIGSRFIRGLAPVDDRMLIVIDIARLVTANEVAALEDAA